MTFDLWIIAYGRFLKLYSYIYHSFIACPSPFVFQWMKIKGLVAKRTTGLVLLTLIHNIQFGLHIVKHKDCWQHFPEIFCLSLYEHQWIPFVQIFSLAPLWLVMTRGSVCDLPSWMSCLPAAHHSNSSSVQLFYWPSSIHQQPNRQWPSLMLQAQRCDSWIHF